MIDVGVEQTDEHVERRARLVLPAVQRYDLHLRVLIRGVELECAAKLALRLCVVSGSDECAGERDPGSQIVPFCRDALTEKLHRSRVLAERRVQLGRVGGSASPMSLACVARASASRPDATEPVAMRASAAMRRSLGVSSLSATSHSARGSASFDRSSERSDCAEPLRPSRLPGS